MGAWGPHNSEEDLEGEKMGFSDTKLNELKCPLNVNLREIMMT